MVDLRKTDTAELSMEDRQRWRLLVERSVLPPRTFWVKGLIVIDRHSWNVFSVLSVAGNSP